MSVRSSMRAGLLAAAVAVAALPAVALAQEEQERPDSVAQRLRERLRSLSSVPGDSTGAIPLDSLRAMQERAREAERGEGAPAGDVVAQLRALPGYVITEYQGQNAEYRADEGLLYLWGDSTSRAAIQSQGDQLQADSIIYDDARQVVDAGGDPVYVPAQGDEIRSRALRYDLGREAGAAADARTQFTEGASWIVTGDMPLITGELAYGHRTSFTSCDLEDPHYHFETDQLKILRGQILVARPVRLYFGDVPVAWLPFVAQSLARGRASGLLTPRFSVNDIVRTSGGYRRRISNVGFYWAQSDYSDMYLALDWFDDNFTGLTGGLQYRWLRQFLDGSLDMRRFWLADGGTELTLRTRHNWEMSERTRLTLNGSYASSSRFVTQNSFDPQELTRSIDSNGGFSHRFDWGSLNVSANRRQYLTDDRVETTLPNVSLSLRQVTLFQAPATRASWYNNLTWTGSTSFNRSLSDFAETADQLDTENRSARANSSLNLGALSLSGSVNYREDVERTAPLESILTWRTDPEGRDGVVDPLGGRVEELGLAAFDTPAGQFAIGVPRADIAESTVNWNVSLSYLQNLIGSTTLTPNLSIRGEARQIDTLALAESFVSAPNRLSFGATLKSDIYGFYPGFGGFSRLRHKITPSITFDYAPEVNPTPLQSRVFNTQSLQATRVVAVTLNQTFEAKRELPDDTAATPSGVPGGPLPGDSLAAADSLAVADSLAAAGFPERPTTTLDDTGLQRVQTGEVVQLLGLSFSALNYDLERADEFGRFIEGITTTEVSTTITSDYLRGLNVSMSHNLFDNQPGGDGGTGDGTGSAGSNRVFDPHLSRLNLGFSLSNQSSIFRWLGLGGSQGAQQAPPSDPTQQQDQFAGGATDETQMIPGRGGPRRQSRSSPGTVGRWSANLSYALNRPRNAGQTSQMISGSLQLQPTAAWDMSWRTGYDLELKQFTDHSIRLTRDLHRWQASFDFRQTATGNWTFRFEVSLIDNEDLKFDYQQRNIDRREVSR